MVIINRLLTKVNYKKSSNRKIKYIVIHYVGATGGAEANCKYFLNTYRGASAHYFVGHKGEVWQCVEDKDTAWHCGSKYKINNSNSIGIEMCCKKKDNWYFEAQTVDAAIELTKMLMNKYAVPVTNVVRHYDVSKKVCPEPYVRDTEAWNDFKKKLVEQKTIEELAKEVIKGVWGNGSERKKRLTEAGYDYKEVQMKVNEILK